MRLCWAVSSCNGGAGWGRSGEDWAEWRYMIAKLQHVARGVAGWGIVAPFVVVMEEDLSARLDVRDCNG